MNPWEHELGFYLVAASAAIVKIITTKYKSIAAALVAMFVSVFGAVIFTEPLITALGWSPGSYKLAVCALLTLTFEPITRSIFTIIENPDKLIDLISAIRGGSRNSSERPRRREKEPRE